MEKPAGTSPRLVEGSMPRSLRELKSFKFTGQASLACTSWFTLEARESERCCQRRQEGARKKVAKRWTSCLIRKVFRSWNIIFSNRSGWPCAWLQSMAVSPSKVRMGTAGPPVPLPCGHSISILEKVCVYLCFHFYECFYKGLFSKSFKFIYSWPFQILF